MTEYQAMSVGGRFDYRNADQIIRGRDIMLLDWDPSGFILIIAMTGMTDREAEIIRKHEMSVSAFTDGECVLPLWRFADSDVYGETPFDPTVYRARIPDSREQIMRANIVTIVGVDSNTMTIRALRAVSLPAHFKRAIRVASHLADTSCQYCNTFCINVLLEHIAGFREKDLKKGLTRYKQ